MSTQFWRIDVSGSGGPFDYWFYEANGGALPVSRHIELPPPTGQPAHHTLEFKIRVKSGKIQDARFNPDNPIVVGKAGSNGCPVSQEAGFKPEIKSDKHLILHVTRDDEYEFSYLINFDVIRKAGDPWTCAEPLDPKIRNKPTRLHRYLVLALFSAMLALAIVWMLVSR